MKSWNDAQGRQTSAIARTRPRLPARHRSLIWVAWIALAAGFGIVATAFAFTEEQAQKGAAVFAFYCSTCHGDRGQGLTDEWRATWPAEDQYCWTPKCHGRNHPYTGFILPRYVPALVGSDLLKEFADAPSLYDFVKNKMPYQDPTLLTDEERWAVIAFLLRQNGIPADNNALDATTAPDINFQPQAAAVSGCPKRQP